MNDFTPRSMQCYALQSIGLFLLLFWMSPSSIQAQCTFDCTEDTTYNFSFDATTCDREIGPLDFGLDTTSCDSSFNILVVDTSLYQDTVVYGESGTIPYSYAHDSLVYRILVQNVDTCSGNLVVCDTVQPTLFVQDTIFADIPEDSCTTDVPLSMDTVSDNCGDTALTIYAPMLDTLYRGFDLRWSEPKAVNYQGFKPSSDWQPADSIGLLSVEGGDGSGEIASVFIDDSLSDLTMTVKVNLDAGESFSDPVNGFSGDAGQQRDHVLIARVGGNGEFGYALNVNYEQPGDEVELELFKYEDFGATFMPIDTSGPIMGTDIETYLAEFELNGNNLTGRLYAEDGSGAPLGTVSATDMQYSGGYFGLAGVSDGSTGAPTGVRSTFDSLVVETGGSVAHTESFNFTLTDVMEGTYSVIYEATDSCTAPVRDTAVLNVNRDNEIPNISCETGLAFNADNLPLPINAETFVDTAFDDCSNQLYYKVRKMLDPTDPNCQNSDNPDNLFDDEVTLCCDNVPMDTVIVRVYDQNPGPGPVPVDTLDGHYATCMVPFEIQDKEDPTLTAPTDLSLECGTSFDSSNLDVFGDIEFSEMDRRDTTINGQSVEDGIADDNCPDNIAISESVTIDTNMCGLGLISRVFTAVDSGGNTVVDTQTIAISREDTFDQDNIDWPEDTTVFNCTPYPDPEITGFPEVDTLDCTMIGWKFEDDVFDLQGGCFKILRRWTIIDWCQNDPNEQDDDWMFTHDQVIKINDTVPPAYPDLDTVTETHNNPECEDIPVSIPPVQATDCTIYDPLEESVQIDYGNDGTIDTSYAGNDASGEYPNGESRVIYSAEDGCGNVGQAEQIVEVVDTKPPSGTVISNLSVNMQMMNGTPMVMVNANQFNPDGSMTTSQDNCTANDDLRFSYSSDVNDNELIAQCDNVGDTTLTIFVWDEAGNSASATSTLTVTDLDSLCPQTTTGATISGQVMISVPHEPMADVEVQVGEENGSQSWSVQTESEGQYDFADMTIGNTYTVQGSYDDDYLNGVSTYDLVLMQRHILGIEHFQNDYQYVAADVDNNRHISATDLVDMRRVILGLSDKFTNNTSWRIIPSNFVLDMHPGKPLPQIPEERTIDLPSDGSEVDLTAVKIGDLNGSMDMDGFSSPEERGGEPVYFEYEQKNLKGGTIRDIAFYASESGSYLGFQGSVHIDPEYAELVYVRSDALPDFTPRSVRSEKRSGEVRFSWNQAIPVKLGTSEPVMQWRLRVEKNCTIDDIISVNRTSISNEIYSEKKERRTLGLQKRSRNVAAEDQLIQFNKVYPNPFRDVTNITFEANDKGTLDLRVLDTYGKELYKEEHAFKPGSNHLRLNLKDLSVSGLLYYQLECNKQVLTGKFFKAKR